MPKFYVRSGRVRRVIDRADRAKAALDTVKDHIREAGASPKRRQSKLLALGLLTNVSELGFNGKDAAPFATHHIMTGEGPFAHYK